jgi:hypothetical protein
MVRHFREVWRERGVDEDITFHKKRGDPLVAGTWAMVPLKRKDSKSDRNFVLLRDAKGLTLHYEKSRLEITEITSRAQAEKIVLPDALQADKDALGAAFDAAAKGSDRLLALSGLKGGETYVDLMDSKGIRETLVVTVHPRREFKLNFNFVALKNGNDKATQLSKRNKADVPKWITDLNRIFTLQANVAFKSNLAEPLPVASYSGATRVYPKIEDWDAEVGGQRKNGADANVFLVGTWKGIGEDKYKDTNGTFIPATKDIIMDDRPNYDLFMTTLPHELGHFLGYARALGYGHPGAKNTLMVTIDRNNGIKIPKDSVYHFNPW